MQNVLLQCGVIGHNFVPLPFISTSKESNILCYSLLSVWSIYSKSICIFLSLLPFGVILINELTYIHSLPHSRSILKYSIVQKNIKLSLNSFLDIYGINKAYTFFTTLQYCKKEYFNWLFGKLRLIFKNQEKNRVFGLDLLRAFAILLVLFAHGFDPFLAEYFPKLRLLIFMDGVDLFFVLSGFLIGAILLRQFNSNTEYSPKIILSFWKRRWLRTLPNYYFVLLLILFVPVIIPAIKGDKPLIPLNTWGFFFVFSQNLFKNTSDFFSEAWSLAVEEWFYLTTPSILFLYYITFKNILSKKRIFLLMMVTIIIVSTVYRYKIGLNLSGDIKEWDANIRRVVFSRLDSIMFGVLGAFFKFYYPIYWKNKSLFPYFNVLGIFLLFITHFFYIEAIDNNTHFFMNTLYFSLSGIAVMMILPQMDMLKKSSTTGIFGVIGKIITHISLISYSLYLTHGYLILGHIVRYKNQYFEKYTQHNQLVGIVYFVLYLSISIIVSTFLYYLIEKPFMNLRSKEL